MITLRVRNRSKIELAVVAVLVSALIVVFMVRKPDRADAASTIVSAVVVTCGQTITVSTTLTADLTNCPGNGVIIAHDSITLNLNGHTIDGTGTGSGVLMASRKSVIVQGGTIKQFSTGVEVTNGTTNTVKSVRLTQNGTGIEVSGGSGNTITLNNSYSNTYGAQVSGLLSKVTTNTFANNATYGLGILLSGAQSSVVSGNHALNNGGPGIFLDSVSGVTLTSNIANGNSTDGIQSNNSPLVTFTTNLANFNGQLGVNAAPGTTDGNGNKAHDNGTAQQCLNVVCS